MALGLLTYSFINKMNLSNKGKRLEAKMESRFHGLRGTTEYSKEASWPARHAQR